MANRSEPTDRLGSSSPWPVLVALGVVCSEVGIVVDLLPVAVVGLLVLSGSVAGILHESRHVGRPWRLAGGFGVVLALVGAGLYAASTGDGALGVTVSDRHGVSSRGLAIAIAGALTVAGAVVGTYRHRTR